MYLFCTGRASNKINYSLLFETQINSNAGQPAFYLTTSLGSFCLQEQSYSPPPWPSVSRHTPQVAERLCAHACCLCLSYYSSIFKLNLRYSTRETGSIHFTSKRKRYSKALSDISSEVPERYPTPKFPVPNPMFFTPPEWPALSHSRWALSSTQSFYSYTFSAMFPTQVATSCPELFIH